MARVPALAEGGIKTVVNGPITFTPDGNPLIGPAFGLDKVWLLTGSSMGVMEGGGAGDFLAKWIVEGEPPMDALALDPRRFGGYADRDYRVAKAVGGRPSAVHVRDPRRSGRRRGLLRGGLRLGTAELVRAGRQPAGRRFEFRAHQLV
jgi:dimethylglycine dehydrogenase